MSMTPLFELSLKYRPQATWTVPRSTPFSMLTVQIESGFYVGMLLLGLVHRGILKLGDTLWALDLQDNKVGEGTV